MFHLTNILHKRKFNAFESKTIKYMIGDELVSYTSPFSSARVSPMSSPRRSRKAEKFFSDAVEDISKLSDRISELSAQNAESNATCEKLERDLEAITSALNNNVDLLQNMNGQLEEENKAMSAEIEKRKEMLEKIRPIFQKLARSGKIPERVDVEFFRGYFKTGPIHFKPNSEDDEADKVIVTRKMDRILVGIVEKHRYFDGVRNTSDFIERVRRLKTDVEVKKKYAKTEVHSYFNSGGYQHESVEQLQAQLLQLQGIHAQRASEDATKLTRLAAEKEEKLKFIREERMRRGSLSPRESATEATTEEVSPVRSGPRRYPSPMHLP